MVPTAKTERAAAGKQPDRPQSQKHSAPDVGVGDLGAQARARETSTTLLRA